MESTTATPAAPAAPAAAPATTPALNSAPVQEAGSLQKEDAAKPAPQGLDGLFQNPTLLIILVGIWVLFFFSWRSNKRKERAQREQREQELNLIAKGDKVVTIGRVHGVVVKADEKTFTIKPDSNKDYTITFDREALLRVVKKDGSTSETAGDLTAQQQDVQ